MELIGLMIVILCLFWDGFNKVDYRASLERKRSITIVMIFYSGYVSFPESLFSLRIDKTAYSR